MQDVDPEQKRDESVKNRASLEVSAKTVQDAISQGLQQLNLTEDQVKIEVINEGSRGILGFGAEDAVVLLTPHPPPVSEEPEAEAERSGSATAVETPDHKDMAMNTTLAQQVEAPPAEDEPAPAEAAPRLTSIDEVDEATQQRAKEILETLLEKMSVNAEINIRAGYDLVEEGETIPVTLDITGRDLGVLIGRRGETLQALQFVLRQILSKDVGRWIPVVVDVESYLVRRRKSLKQLAKRMADRVAFSKRKVMLEPMSAQERRIIHLQLRDHDEVYTQSIGEGSRRKVVIYPK